MRVVVVAIALACMAGAAWAQAACIHTVGGGGGISSSTRISQTAGMALDGNRQLLFADMQALYQMKADGSVAILAGLGPLSYFEDNVDARKASFRYTRPMAYDKRGGRIFLGDTQTHRIVVVNLTSGLLHHYCGSRTGLAGYAGDGLHVSECAVPNGRGWV